MHNIVVEKRNYNNKLNKHSHDYAQLMLPLNGKIYLETEYKKLTLEEKYIFFLPPNCEHYYQGEENNEFLVLDIPKHLVTISDMEKIKGGSKLLLDEKWDAIRNLLLNEIYTKNSSNNINNLFHFFYNFLITENTSVSIKHINENFTEDIKIEQLAEMEHYNPSYYSEWFKKNMGVSPKDYIQNLRVTKAKELLLDTDYTITQIGQIVGYKHSPSFTRVFKEQTGYSPVEYRKTSKIKLINDLIIDK